MTYHPYFIISQDQYGKVLNPEITKFWKYEIVATKKGRNSLSTILETVDKIVSVFGEENINNMEGLMVVGDMVKNELDTKKAEFETSFDIEYGDEDTKYLYQK
eukprot:CAMPEP_0205809232 /NCGR_PEP_ID=MMETSP0205-20121125/13390_1 /ASSEMBLY_ACC=CAM_ASM_000278 /TAXON_ID=36767 /ORGANISM="Euplotes focardii, Strain TN1" /LENGTH=102 /DNA_ID=CAMNT_0053086113 /DNA_START=476 /DNA_END=784 /DNA_ORIENTATION=-